ncbi:MAG: RNA 2',3'-cyclic phosphodiesterase [Candidatus Kapabacteria bacterium]|nr:RNA 2',3'-cyclic phosphodiesterase [Candidatus Kapabacteria bacterium]
MSREFWRLFIGCFVRSEKLTAGYHQLATLCSPWCHAKWVEPDKLHFTLIFLGEVPYSSIPRLFEAIGPLLHEYVSPLSFSGIDVFPNWRVPRVLYIRVINPDKRLWDIYQHLQRLLAPVGLSQQERHPFTPHITVARLKQVPAPEQLRRVLLPYRQHDFGSMETFRPVLIRSVLTTGGPHYSIVSPDTFPPL